MKRNHVANVTIDEKLRFAIEEFVAVQEWQVEAIKEGMTDAEEGRIASHEDALKVLKKWGKK